MASLSFFVSKPESYAFTNTATIIIDHNLGYKPLVYVIMSDGIQSWGEVLHNSDLKLTITFQNSQTGTAYLR
tara:strand:+ start:529 stop:744 length:216 start_codon:yes stop_codon:yes gene_type:complete